MAWSTRCLLLCFFAVHLGLAFGDGGPGPAGSGSLASTLDEGEAPRLLASQDDKQCKKRCKNKFKKCTKGKKACQKEKNKCLRKCNSDKDKEAEKPKKNKKAKKGKDTPDEGEGTPDEGGEAKDENEDTAGGVPLDLAALAAEGHLGSKIAFKIDADWASRKEFTTPEAARKVANTIDCLGAPTRVFRDAGKHEAAHKAAGLDLWYEVKCSEAADKAAAGKEVEAKYRAFLRGGGHKGALRVEPEFSVTHDWTPNDPNYNLQPHYAAVNMENAWDLATGNPNVVVQVLDTGIDMAHPDLMDNIWSNPGEICGNGVDDDGNGFIDDCYGYNHADNTGTDLLGYHWHGTHCGGTVAADSNNGVGVAGVAGGDGTPNSNSGVKLMISVGFGDTNVGGFAEALVYAADNGAHVSSNSWGYTAPGAYQQSVLDAIDYYDAVANGGEGIVVFAAGNSASSSNYYPGYYATTYAVAATQNSGVYASFTNYGTWIDISAPGVNVYSTMWSNGYGYASGTSMACPHVAGIFALGLAVAPMASRSTLIDCAECTAKDIDPLNPANRAGLLGAGLIDAHLFLQCVISPADWLPFCDDLTSPPVPKLPTPAPSPGGPEPGAPTKTPVPRPTKYDPGPPTDRPTEKPTKYDETGKPTQRPTERPTEKPTKYDETGKPTLKPSPGILTKKPTPLLGKPTLKPSPGVITKKPTLFGKPTLKPTPGVLTKKPTLPEKSCCVGKDGVECESLLVFDKAKCETYKGGGFCKWECKDACCYGEDGVECESLWYNSVNVPPVLDQKKCESYKGGGVCKWDPKCKDPCCVGGDGECEWEWWNGNLQTQDTCNDFHGGKLCKWDLKCKEDPCCVGGDGECEWEWWNGNLQTQDTCNKFHGGNLCKWNCKTTPKPAPGDDKKPCCVGDDGKCEDYWWMGDVPTEDKCHALSKGCKWDCKEEDKPGTDKPIGDKPIGDKPIGDKPIGDKPIGDKPGNGKDKVDKAL